jgi:hypothetical protein
MEVLNNDINIELILKLRYFDILELKQTNKKYYYICDSNILWSKMINRDFYFYNIDNINSKIKYNIWYNFFNKYTNKIICNFVLYRLKYDKIIESYEKIFPLLVNYINNIKDKNFKKEYLCGSRNLNYIGKGMDEQNLKDEYDIIHSLFKICNIKIGVCKEFIEKPPLFDSDVQQICHKDKNNWIQMRHFLYNMIEIYKVKINQINIISNL